MATLLPYITSPLKVPCSYKKVIEKEEEEKKITLLVQTRIPQTPIQFVLCRRMFSGISDAIRAEVIDLPYSAHLFVKKTSHSDISKLCLFNFFSL